MITVAERRTHTETVLRHAVASGATFARPALSEEGERTDQGPIVVPREAACCAVAALPFAADLAQGFFAWLSLPPGGRAAPSSLETAGFLESLTRRDAAPARPTQRFAPDQTGFVLWAIARYLRQRPHDRTAIALAERLARGITTAWDPQSAGFLPETEDLWGVYWLPGSPVAEGAFTVAVGTCAAGLRDAGELLGEKSWKKTAHAMRDRVAANAKARGFLSRFLVGGGADAVDASVLFLVFPLELFDAEDTILRATVTAIERDLIRDGGVCRFAHDLDNPEDAPRHRPGAPWPLLNFLFAVILKRQGEEEAARRYGHFVTDRTELDLPRTLPARAPYPSSPDAWTHALFLLAAPELAPVLP